MSRPPSETANTLNDQPLISQAPAPTGYLVSIVPGAIEVSARLGTADELRGLMKALTASGAILSDVIAPETEVLSKRLSKASAA
jgi:hypothetical protein